MADIRIVSGTEHYNKRWVKPPTFAFARNDYMIAVGLNEIPKAMMHLPLAFARADGAFFLIALTGFTSGRNLAVSAQGLWLAEYIPIIYRAYPFRMGRSSDGSLVLCVDHASGLVHDGIVGFRFFEEEKKPSAETASIISMLVQLETDRVAMTKACKLLEDYGVIELWPLQVQLPDGIQTVEGLYRINEAKFNQLSADALAALRDCGGLTLCYGHLFSMQHIQQLGTVAQRQSWAYKQQIQNQQVPGTNITEEEGILSFRNL